MNNILVLIKKLLKNPPDGMPHLTHQELAARLGKGWDASVVSKFLKGKRKQTVSDYLYVLDCMGMQLKFAIKPK